MPVELRKRKNPPAPAPAPARKKSATGKLAKAKEAIKSVVTGKKDTEPAPVAEEKAPAAESQAPVVGTTIDVANFGGELETHDGVKTTLGKLVEESKAGVVIFTYPKASTPGCTKQACQFRDEYTPLTATGFSIYGLSNDSAKANTTFKTKQNLPYTLLCDPSASLISPLGFLKKPKGTTRGVFVVDKGGKVLANGPGSPAETVAVVRKIVEGQGSSAAAPVAETEPLKEVPSKEDQEAAATAAAVADTAAAVDSEAPKV